MWKALLQIPFHFNDILLISVIFKRRWTLRLCDNLLFDKSVHKIPCTDSSDCSYS